MILSIFYRFVLLKNVIIIKNKIIPWQNINEKLFIHLFLCPGNKMSLQSYSIKDNLLSLSNQFIFEKKLLPKRICSLKALKKDYK